MSDEGQALVIDNGSDTMKTGFAGDEEPKSVFASMVGRRKYRSPLGGQPKDIYVGDDALRHSGVLFLEYPITRGVITNWDDMEKLWHDTFYNDLRVKPAEHPVLMTEVPEPSYDKPMMLTWKENREKMIQYMFETLSVPSCYLASQPVLSLYGAGRKTGIVLEAGDGVIHTVPVCEGDQVREGIFRLPLGGKDLSDYLHKILIERGYPLTTCVDKYVVRDIKEQVTYVALDFDDEMKKAEMSSECNIDYRHPDGSVLTIANERFRCPELLFKPHLNGFEFGGIDQSLFDSIMKCDVDVRKDLYANIVLAGGSTMFQSLPERIEKEMTRLAPPMTKVKAIAPPGRKYAAWVGGSVFASLATFPQMAITHEEYKETGRDIVHRKCS